MRCQQVLVGEGRVGARARVVLFPMELPDRAAVVVERRSDDFVIRQANVAAGNFLDQDPAVLVGSRLADVLGRPLVAALLFYLRGPGPVEPRRLSFDVAGRPVSVMIARSYARAANCARFIAPAQPGERRGWNTDPGHSS